MRVLVAHNLYRSELPSGENVVVEEEIAALVRAGVEVETYLPSSDNIPDLPVAAKLATAAGPVFNPVGLRALDERLAAFRPDVLHVHNLGPMISPWAIRSAHRRRVAVVATLHNFRIDCVNGLFFRDGARCTACAGTRLGLPALRHGCYRDSRLQTVPALAGRITHRRTWMSVDRFVVLSALQLDFLRSLGVNDDRILVRPNTAPDPGPTGPPGQDVLYVGRLEDGKGVGMLLDAWRRRKRTGRRLRLVGAGPLEDVVRTSRMEDVELVGRLDQAGVGAALRSAGALVMPSRYLEPLPRVLAEAYAHGRATLASRYDGGSGVVDEPTGWRVQADPAVWADALDDLTEDELRRRGEQARRFYRETLSPERSMTALLETYEQAVRNAA